MSTNVERAGGTETVHVGASLSGLSCPVETLGRDHGPDSESAGQEPARSALKSALKAAGRAAEATAHAAKWVHDRWSRKPVDEDDHELRRLVFRLEKHEEWAPARGLPGLRPVNGGFSFEDVDGLTLITIRIRLEGSMTFSGLVDHGDRLLAYLALTRGTIANTASMPAGYRLTPGQIASGMLAVHRRRSGSVLMIQAGHRADTAVIWIGQSGELKRISREIDVVLAERAAEQAAEEAARQARLDAERAAQRSARVRASLSMPEPPERLRQALSGSTVKPATAVDLIRKALTEGPATGAALAKRTSRSRSEVYRVLGELTARGEVVQEERGGPYRITPRENRS